MEETVNNPTDNKFEKEPLNLVVNLLSEFESSFESNYYFLFAFLFMHEHNNNN